MQSRFLQSFEVEVTEAFSHEKKWQFLSVWKFVFMFVGRGGFGYQSAGTWTSVLPIVLCSADGTPEERRATLAAR